MAARFRVDVWREMLGAFVPAWAPQSLPQRRASEPRHSRQRRLGGVEAEAEILVVVGGVDIGRLVPLWIPAAADLHAALVFAQADRRDQILERNRIGVGHVRADLGRIVAGVLLIG